VPVCARRHTAPSRDRHKTGLRALRRWVSGARPDASTLAELRERVLARFCCLAATITLSQQRARPKRALVI